MTDFVLITVLADVLAPSGARTSAGTVMTKFVSGIYMGPALDLLMSHLYAVLLLLNQALWLNTLAIW